MDTVATDKISAGLLKQFASLKELTVPIPELLQKQAQLLACLEQLDLMNCDELSETSLMMKKMNVYRMKLRNLKSDMLYISKRTNQLKGRAIEIQMIKVNQKAEKVKMRDYEKNLIAKSPPPPERNPKSQQN